jgi:hypothetical protein
MRFLGLLVLGLVVLPCAGLAEGQRGHLETGDLPAYLRDRGLGVPSSRFGTFIQRGQLIVYPYRERGVRANLPRTKGEFKTRWESWYPLCRSSFRSIRHGPASAQPAPCAA